MKKLHTFQNPVPSTPEINSGVSLVERGGYLPSKVQIESFINAGVRLNAGRMNQYDIPPGKGDRNTDVPLDPTRKPGMSLAEAHVLITTASARLKAQKEAQNAKKTTVVVPPVVPSEPVKAPA
jgi:hypothetical protein